MLLYWPIFTVCPFDQIINLSIFGYGGTTPIIHKFIYAYFTLLRLSLNGTTTNWYRDFISQEPSLVGKQTVHAAIYCTVCAEQVYAGSYARDPMMNERTHQLFAQKSKQQTNQTHDWWGDNWALHGLNMGASTDLGLSKKLKAGRELVF